MATPAPDQGATRTASSVLTSESASAATPWLSSVLPQRSVYVRQGRTPAPTPCTVQPAVLRVSPARQQPHSLVSPASLGLNSSLPPRVSACACKDCTRPPPPLPASSVRMAACSALTLTPVCRALEGTIEVSSLVSSVTCPALTVSVLETALPAHRAIYAQL